MAQNHVWRYTLCLSKLPAAKFRSGPGGRGVSANEKFLRWRCLRFSAGALRTRVPKNSILIGPKWNQKGAQSSQNGAQSLPAATKMKPKGHEHATCNAQRATCNVQRATCNAQRATCNVQRATCNVQRATCNTCNVQSVPKSFKTYAKMGAQIRDFRDIFAKS